MKYIIIAIVLAAAAFIGYICREIKRNRGKKDVYHNDSLTDQQIADELSPAIEDPATNWLRSRDPSDYEN